MCPDLIQAWVSWAQFEKRAQQGCLGDHLHRCRSVLQRGLTLNPNNAKLCQVNSWHPHTYFKQKAFQPACTRLFMRPHAALWGQLQLSHIEQRSRRAAPGRGCSSGGS